MKWVRITGLVLVGLAILCFALMGFLYSTRGTPTRAVYVVGDPAGAPAIRDSIFPLTVELLTKTDLHNDHTVEPLFDGVGTFPRLWTDIRAARHTVLVQLYYGKPGALADSLKHALMASAARGVHVLVLFDAFGAGDLSNAYMDSLRGAGVRVTDFRPIDHWLEPPLLFEYPRHCPARYKCPSGAAATDFPRARAIQ